MIRSLVGREVLLCSLGLAGACADTATCDPDQVLVEGACLPRGGTGGGTGADAGTPPPDADAAGDGCAGPEVAFGTSCGGPDDCGCPAPYCAIQPGASVGFCTVTGCKEHPSVCPATYGCLDLTAFGAPSFCAPP